MTILQDVKTSLGVMPNNLGFDSELLLHINSTCAQLVQIGAVEFEALEVDSETDWPTFSNQTILSLLKQFVPLQVMVIFDPKPSETIEKSFSKHIAMLEGRIAHEFDEVTNVV